MKKLLENLLLFNFHGISNTQGSEYQKLYDKLLTQFSLNNPENFTKNSQKIYPNVSVLLQDERLIDMIPSFSDLLTQLGIDYGIKKPPTKKNKTRT